MIRQREKVFVDTGAWIALALVRDPYHVRARELWELLVANGAMFYTSVPVILETFTFLDRNASRDVALEWKARLDDLENLEILGCDTDVLDDSWEYFARHELHKLSAVDATSFVIMKRAKIGLAFSFDHHFATVGFRLVG